MYVCGVPNKKISIFGIYAKWAKSTKCKNGICICVCMCVCVVPNIKLVSLAFMPNEPKSEKYKNGICIYVCMFLCESVFLCVWCVIYKLSIFGMFAKSAKCEFLKKFVTLRILLTEA